MKLPHLIKATGLGATIVALTAGAAMAAVASSSVNVRMGPGTSYGVVDTLQPGEPVDITGRAGGWCEVDKSGPNGWVSCRYLVSSRDYDDDEYIGDDYYYDDDEPRVSIGIGSSRPAYPAWYYDRPGFGFSFSN